MFASVAHILHAAVQLAWPETCACCGTHAPVRDGLCDDCQREMTSLAALDYCPRCGATLGPGLTAGADGCWTCPRPAYRFGGAFRVGPHTGPLRKGIHALKYARKPTAARRLGALLGEIVAARAGRAAEGAEGDGTIDLILPVPMHWLRRLGRGWDHAAALADHVGRRLGLPVADNLVRVRNTPPQVRLPASAREANVRGAFAVRRPAELAGATVLLIDDVMTTGATANEAARTVLAAAERVLVAVCARAEPPTAYSSQLAAPT